MNTGNTKKKTATVVVDPWTNEVLQRISLEYHKPISTLISECTTAFLDRRSLDDVYPRCFNKTTSEVITKSPRAQTTKQKPKELFTNTSHTTVKTDMRDYLNLMCTEHPEAKITFNSHTSVTLEYKDKSFKIHPKEIKAKIKSVDEYKQKESEWLMYGVEFIWEHDTHILTCLRSGKEWKVNFYPDAYELSRTYVKDYFYHFTGLDDEDIPLVRALGDELQANYSTWDEAEAEAVRLIRDRKQNSPQP